MKKTAWPKIRRRGNSWRVDAGVDPQTRKRLQRQFATQADAEEYAADLRASRQATAAAVRFERRNRAVRLTNITDGQRMDIITALSRLAGRGTLTTAADFYLKHHPTTGARTVAEVLADLVTATEAANRRPRTVRDLAGRLGAFAVDFGQTPIQTVTLQDLEQWLARVTRGAAPLTRAAYRRCLFRLFSFAVKRGLRDSNPVAQIDPPSADESEPAIFRPAQVRALLAAAAAESGGALVPRLCVAFFAGLRTESELARLDWKNVDLAAGRIKVEAATAKKRRTRYVDMSANLRQWLAPHAQTEGPIFYSRRMFNRIRAAAGVEWPSNVARHSFGSYHLAEHNDAGRTAAQMGHAGSTAVLFDHYKALVTPEAAREYWSIEPEPAGNVIPFRAVAS